MKDSLLYGRMYLPTSALEMLYLSRRSPKSQLRIAAVSDAKLKNGGTILAVVQQDVGKWSSEYLYSTSEALVGARGLYNFGYDPRRREVPPPSSPSLSATDSTSPTESEISTNNNNNTTTPSIPIEPKLPFGRHSLGAEVYYGVLNKSGGSK